TIHDPRMRESPWGLSSTNGRGRVSTNAIPLPEDSPRPVIGPTIEDRRGCKMKTKRVSAAAIAAAASACLLMGASGCGPSTPDPRQPHTPGNQVAQGAELFVAHCAKCHGAQGQGNATKGVPPLVGANALPLDPRPRAKLRKNQFRTAQDVFDFV